MKDLCYLALRDTFRMLVQRAAEQQVEMNKRGGANASPGAPCSTYDLVMADPPYTGEDANHYGTPMINGRQCSRILTKTMVPGAHLVWLHQMRLQHSNEHWKLECPIAIDCSTNRRFHSGIVYRKL